MAGRLIVVGFAVLFGACGGGASSTSTTTSQASAATTAAPASTSIDGHDVIVRGRATVTDRIAITVNDNYFEPNLLTAAPGSTVTLALESHATALHNISVTSQGIDHDVTPGQSFEAKVVVPASGRLVFFCKYHRDEAGMIGAIN